MRTAHDHLFRRAIARPANAAALLRLVLPARLAAAVDWCSLKAWPSRRVDRRLRAHIPDFVLRALHRHRRASVFFQIEHKSSAERFTALQQWRYELQIHEACRRQRPTARELPLVVSIVISHGRRFRAPRDVARLIDRRWPAFGEARRWPFLLVDLSRLREERLIAAQLPPLMKVTLLFLQFIPRRLRRTVAAAVRRWQQPLQQLARTPGSQEDLEALSSYILFTTDFPADQLAKLLREVIGNTEPTDMITTAERLRRQGRREGLQKGLQKGRLAGQVELLLTLLTERFGGLDGRTRSRVRKANLEQLERWATAVLSARTLARVFAD